MSFREKWAVYVFAAAVLLCLFPSALAAEASGFVPALSETEGREGDRLALSVAYDGSMGEVGTFLVRLEYDPEVLEYQRTVESAAAQEGYSVTLSRDGWVGSGYVCKEEALCLAEQDTPFTYYFSVREGVSEGETSCIISVFQAADPDAEPLESVHTILSYTVLPPPSAESFLTELTPSAGELEPAFSPDWFDYTLTVPFEVTSVTFLAQPAAGAVSKVNRKNLGAGGSDTEFLLTVTAEDGETKTIYRVSVHREEKAVSPKPDATAKPSSSPKPEKTPEPSTAAAVISEKPKASPSPSAAVTEKPQIEKAESNVQAVSEKEKETGQAETIPTSRQTGSGYAGPAVIVNNGSSSLLPMLLILLILVVGFFLSKPLARLLCTWAFPNSDDGEEETPSRREPPS